MTMTEKERAQVRKEVLNEVMNSYEQLIGLFRSGGPAALTGHAFERVVTSEREIKLLETSRDAIKAELGA